MWPLIFPEPYSSVSTAGGTLFGLKFKNPWKGCNWLSLDQVGVRLLIK